MGDCQNYGPFLGPYYNTGPNTGPNLGDPKRDHDFDNPPNNLTLNLLQLYPAVPGIPFHRQLSGLGFRVEGLRFWELW